MNGMQRTAERALQPYGERDSPTKHDNVFIKGVGVHIWQASGDEGQSNWTQQLRSWRPLNVLRFAPARLSGGYLVTERCPDSWNRFEEDARLAKSLGCNGFRLSLEWARLEPAQGQWDEAAVAKYRDMFQLLLDLGLEPNVSLHHFTQPQWFDDLGGWTQQGNIDIFLRYVTHAVGLFGDLVHKWATFNEPVSTASMGFIFGAYPPGHLLQFGTAGEALCHMLAAHTRAYRAIKALPGGDGHQVGICHMILPFDNWPKLGWLTTAAGTFARWMSHIWGYDELHEWMMSGRFKWCVPLKGCWVDWQEPEGRPPCDWFGVNYYSRPIIGPLCWPSRKPGQVLSDLQYPIDPDGLHMVLKRCAAYGVPLYVTETGVSINSDTHREFTLDAYMAQMLRAMADGVDVRGMYYWTLLDNFEWNAGYSVKFGLYAWQPDATGVGDRTPRTTCAVLAKYYEQLPSSVAEVAEWAQNKVAGSASGSFDVPPLRTWGWWGVNQVLRGLQAVEWGLQACGLSW